MADRLVYLFILTEKRAGGALPFIYLLLLCSFLATVIFREARTRRFPYKIVSRIRCTSDIMWVPFVDIQVIFMQRFGLYSVL